MNKNLKKYLKFLYLVCLLFFIFIVFLSFVYKKQKNYKISKNDSLVVEFENSNEFYIKNLLPVSDNLGRNFDNSDSEVGIKGYTQFSIVNTVDYDIKYEIFLSKKETKKKQIKDNYIKVYLTDSSNNPLSGFENNRVPSYNELDYIADKPSSKLVYKGRIDKHSTKKFIMRSWLSDSYAIDKNEEEFIFFVNVRTK